jgi:UDP:flavonoid glycosyltransferase YjiC (YdhE family)
MRIVLTTFGTLGDLLPYLALGQALQARGHHVSIAASASLCDYASRSRLEAIPCYPDLSEEQVRLRYAAFDHWPDAAAKPAPSLGAGDWETFDIAARIRGLLRACRGADLLIRNWTLTGERIVEEILGLRSLDAIVTPERLWHSRFQSFLDELESGQAGASTMREAREHFRWHQCHRRRAGLPEIPLNGWKGYFRSPTLLGVSRHVLEPIDTSSWNTTICGFWFYEAPEWRSWQPDPKLVAFMERSPRPMVLSFSSQPVADPARVVQLHIDAASRIGRPILIQSGWAGLVGAADNNILFRGFMPQDWLFARAACVIHHGGIGTVARALRNGCPMLVEPYGNDQHFNALLVVKGGIGAAVNPKKVRAAEIARVIQDKVLSAETRRKVVRLASCLNHENGLDAAVHAIEIHAGQSS